MIKGNDEISLKFIANKKKNRKHYRQKHSKINRNRRWILSFRCENIKIIKRKDIKHEKYIETLTSILRKKKENYSKADRWKENADWRSEMPVDSFTSIRKCGGKDEKRREREKRKEERC